MPTQNLANSQTYSQSDLNYRTVNQVGASQEAGCAQDEQLEDPGDDDQHEHLAFWVKDDLIVALTNHVRCRQHKRAECCGNSSASPVSNHSAMHVSFDMPPARQAPGGGEGRCCTRGQDLAHSVAEPQCDQQRHLAALGHLKGATCA